MTLPRLHSADNLKSKQWLLLGGRARGLYATAHMMTLGPSDLDLLNDPDLQNNFDLDF